MTTIFLQGLQAAHKVVLQKGIIALEELISELQSVQIENTSVQIEMESR